MANLAIFLRWQVNPPPNTFMTHTNIIVGLFYLNIIIVLVHLVETQACC